MQVCFLVFLIQTVTSGHAHLDDSTRFDIATRLAAVDFPVTVSKTVVAP